MELAEYRRHIVLGDEPHRRRTSFGRLAFGVFVGHGQGTPEYAACLVDLVDAELHRPLHLLAAGEIAGRRQGTDPAKRDRLGRQGRRRREQRGERKGQFSELFEMFHAHLLQRVPRHFSRGLFLLHETLHSLFKLRNILTSKELKGSVTEVERGNKNSACAEAHCSGIGAPVRANAVRKTAARPCNRRGRRPPQRRSILRRAAPQCGIRRRRGVRHAWRSPTTGSVTPYFQEAAPLKNGGLDALQGGDADAKA